SIAGGTNYALVGTTQLLSSPYAMVAGGLVLAPGQGITLTSPNGTPYILSVNDAGQLSLPTSGSAMSIPSNLYVYGTFNSFNIATALQMAHEGAFSGGFKYLTSGTEIKFPSGITAGAAIYGLNGSQEIVPNGSGYTIPSTGFYFIKIEMYSDGSYFNAESIAPLAMAYDNGNGQYMDASPTYNPATHKFTFTMNGVTSGYKLSLGYPYLS